MELMKAQVLIEAIGRERALKYAEELQKCAQGAKEKPEEKVEEKVADKPVEKPVKPEVKTEDTSSKPKPKKD